MFNAPSDCARMVQSQGTACLSGGPDGSSRAVDSIESFDPDFHGRAYVGSSQTYDLGEDEDLMVVSEDEEAAGEDEDLMTFSEDE